MEEYILINDAILCVPGWLAAIGAFLKNNWSSLVSAGAQVVGAVGNLFSQKKANEANAAEAEKARSWQERMYNLHQSPAAQFVERKSAGLNVLDGIQSQSVGSASTAAPAQPLDFSSVAQLPLLFQQLKRAKLDNQFQSGLNDQQSLDYQIKEEQLISQRLQNFEQAFRNGKLDEVYEQQKLLLQAQAEREHWSSKYAKTQFHLLDLQYQQAKEANDSGYNPYLLEFEKIHAEISNLNARTDLTNVQKEGLILANDLSAKFDEKFLQLDYELRKQQVDEFLSQTDKRQEMFDWMYELSEHQYLIQQLQDQYDRELWMSVTNLLKSGAKDGSTFKQIAGILSGYFARDPSAALSSITNLISSLKPEIHSKHIKNNTTVTYNSN